MVASTPVRCVKDPVLGFLPSNLVAGQAIFPPVDVALVNDISDQNLQSTLHGTLSLQHDRANLQSDRCAHICSTGSTLPPWRGLAHYCIFASLMELGIFHYVCRGCLRIALVVQLSE